MNKSYNFEDAKSSRNSIDLNKKTDVRRSFLIYKQKEKEENNIL